MRKIAFAYFTILLLAAPYSHAADKDGVYTVLGEGAASCGRVVEEYKKDDYGKLIYGAWVNGYVTAINSEVSTGRDVTGRADVAARNLWIFNYCNQHPLNNLANAAEALALQLRTRQ